jgi:hypothetical protein
MSWKSIGKIITWMFVGLFVIFCLGVFGVFEPDLKELHKQNQSRPRPEPKEELPVKMIMSGFGCEDRLLVLTLGTMKDDLKAAMWLRAEKEQGNCIEFKAGETVYVDGAPMKIRDSLVQVRPNHCAGFPANGCKKKYWTALFGMKF